MTTPKFLQAAPAVALVAVAAAFAVYAVGTNPTRKPAAAQVEGTAPAELAPTTTARDWQEVAGSRARG